MTPSRHAELKQMLETRRRRLEEQVQGKIREFREVDAGVHRVVVEPSDDSGQDDIDFVLVQMQAQVASAIAAALARLDAGDYGVCHDCGEDIPEPRLRAIPFATRCRACQDAAEHSEGRARRTFQRELAFRPGAIVDARMPPQRHREY